MFGVAHLLPPHYHSHRRRARAVGACAHPEWLTAEAVLDKRRAWRALSLTAFANRHHGFFDRYMYGDKELFHLSFLATATAFTLAPSLPGAVGHLLPDGRFCGVGISQRDPDDPGGPPLLLHRMHAKWNIFSHLTERRPPRAADKPRSAVLGWQFAVDGPTHWGGFALAPGATATHQPYCLAPRPGYHHAVERTSERVRDFEERCLGFLEELMPLYD